MNDPQTTVASATHSPLEEPNFHDHVATVEFAHELIKQHQAALDTLLEVQHAYQALHARCERLEEAFAYIKLSSPDEHASRMAGEALKAAQ